MSVAPWFLDTSSPDEVARANFPIVRRGFDPVEVQAFAAAVGSEIARLQAINSEFNDRMAEAETRASSRVDETTVAQFLGEESSRLLMAARDTANEVRTRSEDYAEVTVKGADVYARNKMTDADAYHTRVGREADADAARQKREAREDAERTRTEARRDADRLIAETMAHRAQLLRDLTQRRDRGLAQLRELLAGRDVLVDAIEQVRLSTSGLIGNLDEISTAPTSFVSLDPTIEGPGEVLQEGASVAVTCERRPAKRRVRPAAADSPAASPERAAATVDGPAPVTEGRTAAAQERPPVPQEPVREAEPQRAPAAALDPITAEVPIIHTGAQVLNGTGRGSA